MGRNTSHGLGLGHGLTGRLPVYHRHIIHFGMVLVERGVLTEASLFRTRPNHVHTYFIKYPADEYAAPKPDVNLTRLSPPHVRVWPARLLYNQYYAYTVVAFENPCHLHHVNTGLQLSPFYLNLPYAFT